MEKATCVMPPGSSALRLREYWSEAGIFAEWRASLATYVAYMGMVIRWL